MSLRSAGRRGGDGPRRLLVVMRREVVQAQDSSIYIAEYHPAVCVRNFTPREEPAPAFVKTGRAQAERKHEPVSPGSRRVRRRRGGGVTRRTALHPTAHMLARVHPLPPRPRGTSRSLPCERGTAGWIGSSWSRGIGHLAGPGRDLVTREERIRSSAASGPRPLFALSQSIGRWRR
jgi:hypothetical protein